MKITIIGAGAFGIAMCKVLEDNNEVTIYTNNEEEKNELFIKRSNERLLKDTKIGDSVKVTTDFKESIETSEAIICAVPFKAIESVANNIKEYYNNQIIISVIKGIDNDTFKSSNELLKEILSSDKVCSLSGPSFAIDVANKENISLMLAGKNDLTNDTVKKLFENEYIQIKITKDEIGVTACSAIKNALAIGSGMLEGMNKSDSTKAAYLTKALEDMKKFILSIKGKEDTVYSSAGVGDLILTCFSYESRNYRFGYNIGKGYNKEEAIELLQGKTIEGISQIKSIYTYMSKNNLQIDLISKLYKIIFEGCDINIILK